MRTSRTVRRILRKTKKKPAYKRGRTIFEALRNVKDRYSKEENSGIYKIPLQDNDENKEKIYIGATARNLKDRLKEHKQNISAGNLTTALSRRAYEANVMIKWKEAKVIRSVTHPDELYTTEKLVIYEKSRHENIVNERDKEGLPTAWKYALTN